MLVRASAIEHILASFMKSSPPSRCERPDWSQNNLVTGSSAWPRNSTSIPVSLTAPAPVPMKRVEVWRGESAAARSNPLRRRYLVHKGRGQSFRRLVETVGLEPPILPLLAQVNVAHLGRATNA